MDKNLVLPAPLIGDETDRKIYDALPNRYGDCASTRSRKKMWRREARMLIDSAPVLEFHILNALNAKDTHYEQ